jgi:hypothetical protein
MTEKDDDSREKHAIRGGTETDDKLRDAVDEEEDDEDDE